MDLIAKGREWLNFQSSPESYNDGFRVQIGHALGMLALAEQFKRLADILEKSDEATAT